MMPCSPLVRDQQACSRLLQASSFKSYRRDRYPCSPSKQSINGVLSVLVVLKPAREQLNRSKTTNSILTPRRTFREISGFWHLIVHAFAPRTVIVMRSYVDPLRERGRTKLVDSRARIVNLELPS